MKTIIIDDEPNSHEALRHLLAKRHPDIQVIASGHNVAEGIGLIRAHQPELVFLDIEMPDGTGFDLLQQSGNPGFMVVFITAHNKYAITAIHFGALDYLLKPISPDALDFCLTRVREKHHEGMIAEQIRHAFESYQKLQQKALPTRMLVSTHEGMHFIPVADIVRLEALQNSTEIFYTGAKKRMIASVNIGSYEEQFEPYSHFMRVHRAHIVNLLKVDTYVRGDAHLLMNDNSKVAVSKENREELVKRLREI
jgi:two-component system LytT family response regulator